MPCTFQYEFKDLDLILPNLENVEDVDDICVPKVIDKDSSVYDIKVCCSKVYENGHNFDYVLCKLWDEAQLKGFFRYTYRHVPFKILPGQFQYIAQLNTDRAEKRRDPEPIQSLDQPFNPAQFNFTKAKQEEVIFEIKPCYGTALENVSDGESNDSLPSENPGHQILINVSPLEYGNVLLVPFLSYGQPQRVTKVGLRLALELMLLSRSRNFRVGFNSLCAYASVNHLHFHGYYLNHRLYLEYAELKKFNGPCMEICNYPAHGFAFQLTELEDEKSIENFVDSVYKLVDYLQTNNHPHNIYMTRGSSNSQLGQFDCIRLFVWARSPSYGAKVSNAFNPAVCEIGGHIVLKTEGAYEEISEEMINDELGAITMDIFNKIRDSVYSLYLNDDALLQNCSNSLS